MGYTSLARSCGGGANSRGRFEASGCCKGEMLEACCNGRDLFSECLYAVKRYSDIRKSHIYLYTFDIYREHCIDPCQTYCACTFRVLIDLPIGRRVVYILKVCD